MGSLKQRRTWATGIIVSGLLALSVPPADATIITSGCANVGVACTLAELAGGASIQVDEVTFDTWSVTDFSNNLIDLSSVDVVPLDDQPANVGLAFAANGELSTTGLDLIDLSINFAATNAAVAQQISGVSFELTDFTFGAANAGGFIVGFEDVLDSGGGFIDTTFVVADNLPPPVLDLFDSTTFPPTSAISIEKLILIAGDDPGDTVSLEGFEQRFQLSAVAVPVPATLLLYIAGISGLAWAGRTKRSSLSRRR